MFNQNIITTDFDVMCEYQNCWIDLEGNIIPFNNIKYINGIFKNLSKEQQKICFDYITHNNSSISEWLIINGYLLILDSKVNYYIDKNQKPTEQQCNVISCILYNNILIDKNSKLGKKVIKSLFKNEYNFKQKYYDKMLPHAKNIFSSITNKDK